MKSILHSCECCDNFNLILESCSLPPYLSQQYRPKRFTLSPVKLFARLLISPFGAHSVRLRESLVTFAKHFMTFYFQCVSSIAPWRPTSEPQIQIFDLGACKFTYILRIKADVITVKCFSIDVPMLMSAFYA